MCKEYRKLEGLLRGFGHEVKEIVGESHAMLQSAL